MIFNMDKYIFRKRKSLSARDCEYIINLFEKSNSVYDIHDYYSIHPYLKDIKYNSIASQEFPQASQSIHRYFSKSGK